VKYRTEACRVVQDRRNAVLRAADEQTEYRGTQRQSCHLAEHPQCGRVSFRRWSSPRSALYANRVGNNYVLIVRVTRHNYAIIMLYHPCSSSSSSSICITVSSLLWLRLSSLHRLPCSSDWLLTSRIRCRRLYILCGQKTGPSNFITT